MNSTTTAPSLPAMQSHTDYNLVQLEQRLACLEQDHDNLKQFCLEHIKNLINRTK